MSDLLNSASLVMVPSGYKEDTVYSVVPSDGSGDLSFTRASNGTRVNSAGLVEVCPWNLVTYSNDFSNAVWNKNNINLTSGQTDKDGGTNAWKVDFVNVPNDSYVFQELPAGQKTGAVWVKGTAGQTAFIGIQSSVASNLFTFDGTWQQIVQTTTNIYFVFSNYGASATATTFLMQYVQANIGTTLKPYFPTTDRLNVPRLTYQNGGGGCPSLLLEKQSTNLILQSNTFNTTWAMFTGPAVTPNTTTSPDGTTSATTLNSSGGTNDFLYQTLSGLTVGATYSFSFYIKNLNSTASRFWGPSGSSIVDLSWSGSTLVSISGTGASFTSVGNDWYRVVQTGTTPTATPTMRIYADVNNTSKSVYIYGAQFEAGSYPTSYIPTTSSSATRVADACFKTGISSLIGQTEGVIFYDGVLTGISNAFANLINSEKNTTGSFALGHNSSGVIFTSFYIGGANVINIQGGSFSVGTRTKIAFAYKSGSSALYVNGTQIGTSSATFTPIENMDDIYIGDETTFFHYKENTQVNQVALFKTRLTNAELASLTTI
jgi:hypothetical protein